MPKHERAMRIDLPYLSEEQDRHKNNRLYARRNGRRVRLKEEPGTPEFLAEYQAAMERLSKPGKAAPVLATAQKGTLGWLAGRYFASNEFRGLAAKSQATRRSIIEDCLREPIRPGSAKLMRQVPIDKVNTTHIKALRDRKEGLPAAANNRRKYLSSMFGWAVEAGHMTVNPARDVRKVNAPSDGYYTWTLDDIRKFEERHPIGTKARLALALLLYTGARRQDVVTFGKRHIKDGWLRFVPQKTNYKRRTKVKLPVLPVLAEIIEQSPCGDLTFLVTEYGKPFTAAGFGNWFRSQCDKAGLTDCTAHGLRKAGATMAAEKGATDRQLMALYGWTSSSQATTYTAAADRTRMAGEAARLLSGAEE